MLDSKYSFTHEWYKSLLDSFELLKNEQRAEKLKFKPDAKRLIVEIGIYEGGSTVWWSDNFLEHPESRLITIDPFTGSEDHFKNPEQFPTLNKIEQIAKSNIAKGKYPGKVEIKKGLSWNIYPFLQQEIQEGIDILYVDGSHETIDVIRDLSLYYPHVKSGGAIILDDYADYWVSVKKGVDSCVQSFMELENGFKCVNQLWLIKK